MRARFITSGAKPGDFPSHGLPEVAFLGRSNVGKSSLLNAVVGARIARTSRTPGRTQLVNFFEAHTKAVDYALADLPGLGYAKVPREIRDGWRRLIESYLETRAPLRALLLLLDLRRGAQEEDVALFARMRGLLEPRGVSLFVVGTKADKLSKPELKPALAAIAKALGVDRDRVLATSVTKNAGVEELRAVIEGLAADRG